MKHLQLSYERGVETVTLDRPDVRNAFNDVHEVVQAQELDGKVAEIAQALVNAGPQAVKECKQLVHDVAGRDITPSLVQRTVEGIADIRASDEGREGVQSFLAKRKPAWLLG